MSQMRDATKNLAIATKTKKSFATNFGNKLDPLHSWGDARLTTLLWSQGDAMWSSCRNKFERIHQLIRKTLSSSSVTMCVVLVRQFVHLTNHFFSATQFDHGLSEPCITHEPIVNAQEVSFHTLLLELIRSVVFLITFFLAVSVTVWSTFPDVKVRNREEVKNWLDVLVLCRLISQEVTARAVDDADVPVRQTYFALCFGFNIE